MKIDLHTHSTWSDGSLSPAELVHAACERGVGVLALTDHDTTAGLTDAADAARSAGIDLIPGIELSVCEQDGNLQLHLLGYGFDPTSPALLACTSELRTARVGRFATMIERLRALGVDPQIELDEAQSERGEGTLGRPHLASRLVELGHCRYPQEAFDRYIGRGKPAFVPPPQFAAARAIDAVHAAGGAAVLAHPLRSTGIDAPGGAAAFIGRFAKLGLDGIEIQHPAQSKHQRKRLTRIANDLGLVTTGGSDFHGAAQPDVVLGRGRGDIHVDGPSLARLRARIRERAQRSTSDASVADG